MGGVIVYLPNPKMLRIGIERLLSMFRLIF